MYREGRPQRKTLPLNLIIDARPSLVVGGGRVGLRKVRGLLEAGAPVMLICPDAVDELRTLAEAGTIIWQRRLYQAGDAAGKFVIFACTDDKHVNRAILEEARAAHVSCCCCDMNWSDADFTTPATARLGDVTIAVSTSGLDCRTARDVKREIMAVLEGRRSLKLVVMGTSDAILASKKRAPYHLPAAERAVLGPMLKHVSGVAEFFILNTCNRVEIAAVVNEAEAMDITDVLMRLAGFDRLAANERFVLEGFEAFRHLTRVASGLESSLLGECHITNQLKEALDEAAGNGWSAGAIAFTGAEVLRVSKRVRHEVEGLLRVAEIDQVAVRYLSVHGGLDERTRVAVIGTGMVGRGAVEALVGMGTDVLWVYHAHLPDVPENWKTHVRVFPWAELEVAVGEADVVMSAVDSSQSVVTPSMCERVANRNVLMVDLGVPRNIDPFYDDYGHGVTVADLDDLKLWHRVKTGTLNAVLEKADAIIRAEYELGNRK